MVVAAIVAVVVEICLGAGLAVDVAPGVAAYLIVGVAYSVTGQVLCQSMMSSRHSVARLWNHFGKIHFYNPNAGEVGPFD